MLVVEFFTWWYSRGFVELLKRYGELLQSVWQRFSVGTLLGTLFAPWRRITTDTGRSMQERSRALVDNLVSRLVGFTIRFFVIITAMIAMLALTIIGAILAISWPLAPLLVLFSVAGAIL